VLLGKRVCERGPGHEAALDDDLAEPLAGLLLLLEGLRKLFLGEEPGGNQDPADLGCGELCRAHDSLIGSRARFVSGTASCDDRRMESILDAIGNTPLVRVHRCAPPNGAELWLKLENHNPTGSMKDRMARAMIEGAERDGLLSPGDTVVEYTGGSTGPALALVCRAKGYRALIVIADCFTEERMQLMRALGAELDVIPSVEGPPKVTPQDIANMVARSEELAAQPGHYATDQFKNPYVIPDHRDRLGAEIWEQTGGRVTAFCHGMGTAASVMGVSDALRPHGVFIQAHEPASSAAISGGEPGPFLIQGWTGSVMPHWDPDRVDHLEPIEDDAAVEMTRRLAAEDGIFAGISTGANVVGAHRLAERLGPEALIVTLAVDSGFKYMSVSPYGEV
jgi:cysteine synthase A